jgi:DNA-binding transcriptional LysR family regulator
VDLAVTLSAPTDPRLSVELLTPYGLALYSSAEYLSRRGAPRSVDDLVQHDLVGYVDDLIYAPELKYLDEVRPGLRPALASSSIRAQKEMIAAGGGIGVLPTFLAQGLEPVLADQVRLTRRFWISAHQDVAATARLKAVISWLKAVVAQKGSILAPGV